MPLTDQADGPLILLTLLALTPLNLPFDRFSQHCERSSNFSSTLSTRASVPRSTLIKRLSEYLDVGAIRCLAFLGIAVLLKPQ
jgi:hypothetical protein